MIVIDSAFAGSPDSVGRLIADCWWLADRYNARPLRARRATGGTSWLTIVERAEMLDIGGFLTSTEFLAQIASIVVTMLATLVGQLITNLFGGA